MAAKAHKAWGVEETGGSIWVGELRPAPRQGFDALIVSLELDGLTATAKARNRARAHLIAAAPAMRSALEPFLPAYEAYVETVRSFTVTGMTEAEQRFSVGERYDAAREAAFAALGSITFEQLAAVAAAIAKASGEAGE